MSKVLFVFLLVVVAVLSSCRNSTIYKPNITGAMGEVLMVMDDRWRNSSPGEAMQEILRQPMEGLPQAEPIFDLSTVPHRAFTGSMRTFRNLIITNIGEDVETEGVKFFSESSWAKGQALVHINARTPEGFLELIGKEELRILGFFLRTERVRSLNYYTKYINSDLTNKVSEKWQMRMVVPTTFAQNASSDTFTWMSAETPSSSQGLMIYSFDYIGEGTFSREYLLNKRDSILMVNVPGSAPGSYMSTEHNLPVTYKTLKVNNHDVVELRGLWKVIGDLMGGPFVMFAHHDKVNNRVVVTDGYVYSPEKPDKRNQVWQVESVLYSVQFDGDSHAE
jgi:hypothetical protein